MLHCHNCGRSMRAPALSVTTRHVGGPSGTSWTTTAHYGPRCAAKIQPSTRARAHLPKAAAPVKKPRAPQSEADERQMVLELAET